MTIKLEDCPLCDEASSLVRVPSLFSSPVKDTEPDQKVGSVVHSHIEEAREDIRKEKEKMFKEWEE